MKSDADATYQSLKGKILATMIVVPILPFVMVLGIGYYSYTKTLEEATLSRLARIAEDHRNAIQSFLDERLSDLRFITESYSFDEIRRGVTLEGVFTRLSANTPAFVDLGVFDAEGNHVAYQGPYQLQGKNYRHAEWFQEVDHRGYYVSDVFLGYRNSPHFVIAVAQPSGPASWVLRATIDSTFFSRLVGRVRIGKTGEAYIVNRDGVFQTQRRSGGELLEKSVYDLQLENSQAPVQTSFLTDARDTSFVYAAATMNDDNWILTVRQEVSDAFRPLRQTTSTGLLILIVGSAVILALAHSTTNLTIRRIRQADEDRNRLNQQLIVASRLAEIGEMSAAFAHEINNPLQIIRSEQTLIDTILDDLVVRGELSDSDEAHELRSSVDQIRQQVDRCGSITQGVLKFARHTEPSVKNIRLWELIPEVVAMVGQQATVNGIRLRTDVADTSCRVQGDPAQLQQVLLNLLNNAFDAVIARHGGRAGEVCIHAEADEDLVTISICDNGTGIASEISDKVFTPFFTTKAKGQGTGLGLPVCFGIIEAMGGDIRLMSNADEGTTAFISLPRAEAVTTTQIDGRPE